MEPDVPQYTPIQDLWTKGHLRSHVFNQQSAHDRDDRSIFKRDVCTQAFGGGWTASTCTPGNTLCCECPPKCRVNNRGLTSCRREQRARLSPMSNIPRLRLVLYGVVRSQPTFGTRSNLADGCVTVKRDAMSTSVRLPVASRVQ